MSYEIVALHLQPIMVAFLLLLCILCTGTQAEYTTEESDFMVEASDKVDTTDDVFKLYDFTFFPEETDQHQRTKRFTQTPTTLCLMTFNIENYASGPDNRNRNQAIVKVSVTVYIAVLNIRYTPRCELKDSRIDIRKYKTLEM